MDINNLILSNNDLAVKDILKLNQETEKYGLKLSEKQIIDLINNKNDNLKEKGRIEVSDGVLEKIIYEFYDSSYIDKTNYTQILKELTNVFYLYQSELDNKLTDEQIITYMKNNFENISNGSIEILESLCLETLKEKLNRGLYYE